jgi:hypothetical protein
MSYFLLSWCNLDKESHNPFVAEQVLGPTKNKATVGVVGGEHTSLPASTDKGFGQYVV